MTMKMKKHSTFNIQLPTSKAGGVLELFRGEIIAPRRCLHSQPRTAALRNAAGPAGSSPGVLARSFEASGFSITLSPALTCQEQTKRNVRMLHVPPSFLRIVTLCLLAAPLVTLASTGSAFREYQAGQYDAALQEYQRLAQQKTNDYRLLYNAGTSAYSAKQFNAAQQHLNETLKSPAIASDLDTQEHTYYNLGNTLYHLGEPQDDPKKKKEMWQQAIENYSRALSLKPQDLDATNNLAFVRKQLEELQQQQQQQQKQDQKDHDQNQDQDKQQQQQKQNQQDQKDQQQDQQQQAKNDQQQKQDQPKQDQQQQAQKKDQDKQQQKAQQAKQDQDKKDQAQQAQAGQKKDGQPSDEQEQAAAAMMAGQMTPEQARQLLDAAKEDEKAMIFQPDKKARPAASRVFKDW